MKSKFLSILLVLAVFLTLAAPVRAAGADITDQFALEYLQAVNNGQSSFQVTVPTGDLDSVLGEAFDRYPVLYFYYDGFSSTYTKTSTTATFQLKDTHIPWQDVLIVDSDADMKAAIGLALANLQENFSIITVGGYNPDSYLMFDLAHELIYDSYLSYMGFSTCGTTYYNTDLSSVMRHDVTIYYWEGVSLTDIAQWRNASEQRVIQLATSLFALDMPDYRRELLIHDWLVNNNRYNTQDTSEPMSHMAYSALVAGNPVCQGYSEAMVVLCQAAGLPCEYIEGMGTNSEGHTESHSWNAVQLGGQWYLIDVTWDDPTGSTDTLRYDYFNITSQQMAKDHTWDQSTATNCTATTLTADYVRQLCENDTTVYTQYTADLLVTQQEAIDGFEQVLSGCVPTIPTPVQTPVETTPVQTEPEYNQQTPIYTVPQYNQTEPQYSPDSQEPIQVTVPEYTRPGRYDRDDSHDDEEEEEEDGSYGWVSGLVAVICIAGVCIFFWSKKKKEAERRRKNRPTFDPTEPFDPTNLYR